MTTASWVVLAVLVLLAALLLGFWLSWTAHRLDRLHHRTEVAGESVRTQLLGRSGACLELATCGALDPASSVLLADAAHQARASRPDTLEEHESVLSQALRAVLADPAALRQVPEELQAELAESCRKVEMARRFHNDQVVAARALWSRRRVRWFRLAGHAGPFATIDLDDEPPRVLTGE